MMRATGLALASATSLLILACVSSSQDFVIGTRDNEEIFDTPQGGDAGPSPDAPSSARMCPSNECPAGKITCANSPFPCSVDLNWDDENCGACGVRCENGTTFFNRFQGRMRCIEGACRLACDDPYADCNGLVEDGCEVNLRYDDDKNCGGCGIVCADFCRNQMCGCPGNMILCDGVCTDILEDGNNCGACGNVCPAPTQVVPANWRIVAKRCSTGECNRPTCSPFFGDCDHDTSVSTDGTIESVNGCETFVATDPKNCLACGNACAPGEACSALHGCVCPCGAVCDTAGRVLSDINHCGACGNACPGDRRSFESPGLDPAHGQPVCDEGICGYTCTPNWGNCDGNIDNGCETNFLSDPLNCGGCGIRCDGVEGQPCVDGRCLTEDCTVIQ